MTKLQSAAATAASSLLAFASAAQSQSMPTSDAAGRIASLRAQSNAAIAAKDLEAIVASATPQAMIVGGNGGIMRGVADIRAGWAEQIADPSWIDYVRTPAEIVVSGKGDRAAESGDWVGRYRAEGGETRLSGRYFVHWISTSGDWRTLSETYVTLACEGPGC